MAETLKQRITIDEISKSDHFCSLTIDQPLISTIDLMHLRCAGLMIGVKPLDQVI
jgi:hypothetical protein